MAQEKMEEAMKEEKKEEAKDEKKEEKEEEEACPEIVLKVDMHCEACARKVARALKGFEGVEEVTADSRKSKVVVKGKKADPLKVCERLQKKSGKKVELISPLPKPSEEKEKEGENEEDKDKEAKQKPEEKKEEEAAAVVTVVLKVGMHCEACAQVIHKRIRKIQGVESVETDLGNDRVVVKGVIEADKLVEYVYKRTGKQASIVKDEEKKDEEKKEEDKKKQDEHKEQEEENDIIKRMEYLPSKYFTDYAYDSQIFSDENPNACFIM